MRDKINHPRPYRMYIVGNKIPPKINIGMQEPRSTEIMIFDVIKNHLGAILSAPPTPRLFPLFGNPANRINMMVLI